MPVAQDAKGNANKRWVNDADVGMGHFFIREKSYFPLRQGHFPMTILSTSVQTSSSRDAALHVSPSSPQWKTIER